MAQRPIFKTRQGSNLVTDESVTKAVSAAKESLLILWNDLPTWQRDNHYILSGYRRASNSFWLSFRSIGYLHNESVNIWTHLFGALLFLFLFSVVHSLIEHDVNIAQGDFIAFSCFFLGACICLGVSAAFHTFSNHSHEVASFGNKLDYVGIVFLIAGSFIPSVYYGFYCEPILQRVYWTMICTIGFGCACVSIIPKFRTPEWRPFRAGMFVSMGLSAVFPVLHGIMLYGMRQVNRQMGLLYVVIQGALYIFGAALYAMRFPESRSPGKFDIWGSSHQWFHVLVVLAAITHLIGLLEAYKYNHGPESRC